MNISNWQRITKLVKNLAANPGYIPKYIRHNLLTNRYPMDWDLPWWSYGAIDYVDNIVSGKKIFEYGTGGSTTRYAKLGKSVTSVEDDPAWHKMLMERLSAEGIKNVEVLLNPFDFNRPENFIYSDYLNALDSDDYDIVIIDGQDKTFNERKVCYYHAEKLIRSGSVIIVDDFWRYRDLEKNSKAKDILIFESVGPCRLGVTSTAVFKF